MNAPPGGDLTWGDLKAMTVLKRWRFMWRWAKYTLWLSEQPDD